MPALYKALASVGGKVTKKVREAIDAEKAARARLPPDSRGLVVIMADIGQGRINGAVIAIEEAKADLADALEPVEEPSGGALSGSVRGALTADRPRVHCAQPIVAIRVARGGARPHTRTCPEARSPCRSVSSPTSRGTSPRTSSSSRSSASPAFEGPLDELDRRPAASCARSPHSAS